MLFAAGQTDRALLGVIQGIELHAGTKNDRGIEPAACTRGVRGGKGELTLQETPLHQNLGATGSSTAARENHPRSVGQCSMQMSDRGV